MKKYVLPLIAMITLSLCSCKNTDTPKPQNTDGESVFETKDDGQKIIAEKVIIDYGNGVSFPAKAYSYKAQNKQFGESQMIPLFLNTPEKHTEGTRINFELGNQHGIIDNNFFFYYTDSGTRYDDAAAFLIRDYYAKKNYLNAASEFDFKSRGEAMNDINKTLTSMGFDTDKLSAVNYYGISKEAVEYYNKNEEESIKNTDTDSVNPDDFYYLELCVKADNLPIYSGGVLYFGSNPDDSLSGTRFKIIYTEKGIEFMSVMFFYEATEKASGDSALIGFDAAQKLLREKYEEIFFESFINVNGVELIYLPFPQNTIDSRYVDFILTPYYVFYAEETVKTDGESVVMPFTVCFNAYDGKEL